MRTYCASFFVKSGLNFAFIHCLLFNRVNMLFNGVSNISREHIWRVRCDVNVLLL